MARQRPLDFEDRLTLVEHLDELRARIVVSISAFAVAAALCFWQNGRLLDIANAPLPDDHTPITFGVAEPFTTTVTITMYAAIVISLPVILYQAYAYVLPALTDRERRVIVPFLVMVPALFCAGGRLRLLRRPAGRNQVPSELQREPVQHPDPGEGLLQLLHHDTRGDGADLPAADRDPRRQPARDRHSQAVCPEPPLRLPGDRRRRDGPTGHRPRQHASGDGPPDRPLRGQPGTGAGARHPGPSECPHRDRDRGVSALRTTPRCRFTTAARRCTRFAPSRTGRRRRRTRTRPATRTPSEGPRPRRRLPR